MTKPWFKKCPTSPDIDFGAAAAQSANTLYTLFYGGVTSGAAELAETWQWTGVALSQIVTAAHPDGKVQVALAWDAANNEFVAFGGYAGVNTYNTTWTFNGTNWTKKLPAAKPSIRATMMVFDYGSFNVVLFGGTDDSEVPIGETWTWNGVNWTHVLPAHSPPVGCWEWAQIAWDPVNNYVLYFGGYDGAGGNLLETWSWDGFDWTQHFPAHNPVGLRYASMGGIVGYGIVWVGTDGVGGPYKTWTWNGTDWVNVTDSSHQVHPGNTAYIPGGRVGTSTDQEAVLIAPVPANTIWGWAPPPCSLDSGSASGRCGTATLTGSLTPGTAGGDPVTWYFEWGTDPSFGNTTAGGTADGSSPVSVSDAINGLTANTTYYFRLVTVYDSLTTYGDTETFVLDPCPPYLHADFSLSAT